MQSMKVLGERIKAARVKQRYDIQSAARAAGIARDTWKKIEDGGSVQDTKRQAALDLLGLDDDGTPVGGDAHDASSSDSGYVNAPGATIASGITNEDLLREILRSRADSDQIRAELRDGFGAVNSRVDVLQQDFAALSNRVAQLEQRGP